MIKVSILYPTTEGARFDHEYYRERHLPMIAEKMGPALLRWTTEQGVHGGRPGSPPPFVAACHLYAESQESFDAAFGPILREVMADVPSYTDVTPQMQVSEVTADSGA